MLQQEEPAEETSLMGTGQQEALWPYSRISGLGCMDTVGWAIPCCRGLSYILGV